MRVVVDESARRDLDAILKRIAQDSPAAARREIEMIRHVIGLLAAFPGLSRDGRVKGTREKVVSGTKYIIVFELWKKPAALVVTSVVHGARNR